MSVWKMIASDFPLPAVKPEKEYPLEINLDQGTIDDGGADDNFTLSPFPDNVKAYTDRKYGATLFWYSCTEGRAARIIEIIKATLQHTESVELWNFWLGTLGEHERPFIKTVTIPVADLTPHEIQEWDIQQVWRSPSRPGDRPTFYCLRVTK